MKDKSTGWKIPLIFCAIILTLVAATSVFIKKDEKLPDLPQSLVDIAKTMVINLDNDQDRPWRDGIMAAAGGFAGNEEKDRKLEKVISKAIDQKRFDAASLAIELLKNQIQREDCYQQLLEAASQDCSTMPWGVFAVYGAKKSARAGQMAQILSTRWQNCAKQ